MAKDKARHQTRRTTLSPPRFAETSNQLDCQVRVGGDASQAFESIGLSGRCTSDDRTTLCGVPSAKDYCHAHRKLEKKIKKAAKCRAEAKYEQSRVTYDTKLMRETISELHRLLSGVDASAGAKAFGNRLPSTLKMLKEYAEKLVEHGRKQEALGFAEEKLYHQSSIFEKCISEIGQTLPHHFRAGTPEATSTTASCSSKRVTHPDPVLDYLAKRSAVEIFQERIIDLRDEFHEEKANRSLQRDQDIELDFSDEDFEQYYEGLVQNNLAEMEQKIQEMNAAETKCYQLGLDVNIRLKDWAVEESETRLPDSPQSLPASDLQDLLTPTNERIIQWRDEIAAYDLAVRKGQIVSNDYFFPEAYRVSGSLRRIKSEPLFSTRWHVRHQPQAAEM